jgi:hypothetical protein
VEETGGLGARWNATRAADAYVCTLVGIFSEWLRRGPEIDMIATAEPMLDSLFAGFRA